MTIGSWAVAAVSAGQSADETVAVNFDHLALFVRAGPADNQLTVSLDTSAGQYVIDSNVPVSPSSNCEATTATEARCDHFVDGESMHVEGRRGDDRITLLAASHPGAVNAGPGDDRVVTGPLRNEISGAAGHDFIKAGPGNDLLFGDQGRDALYAESGNDRVHALDDETDRVIDCGPGEDIAWIDPQDPPARHCEKVDFSDGRLGRK
jgi:Ca2+-binding RTX toxin-like protein